MSINLKQLKPSQESTPPRIVLYAVPGWGKTTLASEFPKALFIPTEEGFGDLKVTRTPLASTWEEFEELLQEVATQDHDFKTLVVDSITKLEALIFNKVCRDQKKESIEDIGFAKGYIFAIDYWQKFFNALNYISKAKGMTILCNAHSIVQSFQPPGLDAFDRYQLDIHKKSARQVLDWADVVLFGNYKILTAKKGDKHVGMNAGGRYIYTEERPSHWGKNRYSMPYELTYDLGKGYEVINQAITKKEN